MTYPCGASPHASSYENMASSNPFGCNNANFKRIQLYKNNSIVYSVKGFGKIQKKNIDSVSIFKQLSFLYCRKVEVCQTGSLLNQTLLRLSYDFASGSCENDKAVVTSNITINFLEDSVNNRCGPIKISNTLLKC